MQNPGAKNAPRERVGLFETVNRNTTASEDRPGRDAARAQRSGASLIRDRQGVERSTQVGFTRLAQLKAPISSKSEIGVCKKQENTGIGPISAALAAVLWKPHPEEALEARLLSMRAGEST
jgi:hypothetical protein